MLQREKFFHPALHGSERRPLARLEICIRTNRRRNHGTGLRLPTLAGALSFWFQGASLLARMPRHVAWPFRLVRLRARIRVILCYFAYREVVTSAGRSMCNVAHRPAGGGSPAYKLLLARFLRRVLRPLICFQRRLVRLERMLHGLSRMLLTGLVVFFSVVHGGRAMRVRRLFVEFRRALMRIVGHDDPFVATENG